MFVTDDFEIIRKSNGEFWTIIGGNKERETDPSRISELAIVYDNCRTKAKMDRPDILDSLLSSDKIQNLAVLLNGGTATTATVDSAPVDPAELVKSALLKLVDFFSEFQFEPNFRFVNTLAWNLTANQKKAKDYIQSYFELTDSPFANDIREKMKSREFSEILKNLSAMSPTKEVNSRFKLYYGSQGTGKTTIAQKETDQRCVVCNNSMVPADLMEDFVFVDGKATFNPSMLWQCMEDGKPIVLDEINLLPFDSLRFLQGVLDGKSEFQYKGKTVHINKGFMVIGTMNLTVNGMTYGLPEPLVDRCREMKKFKLTADALISAI